MSWSSQGKGNGFPGRTVIGGIVIAFIIVVLASSSLFIVNQTEQALITQFGRPVRVITAPGLYLKMPFIQTVLTFDRRLLMVQLPSEEVILGDQRRLIVDSFTMFRITDPLHYFQAVGPGEEGVRLRLVSIATSAIRRVLGQNKLLDVLSIDRDRIMQTIRQEVNSEMVAFGVDVEDVRIRRADLPNENTQAILSRMQSERERVASQARAEGAEASAKIRAGAERDRTVILADARATAEKLRGEGEAEASRTYAAAYGRDPGFFAAWRTMQAYRAALIGGSTRLVLTPGNDFFKLLQSPPAPAK